MREKGTPLQEIVRALKQNQQTIWERQKQAAIGLAAVGELWRLRLAGGWQPPEDSSFPWSQVRISLAALIPGLKTVETWQSHARDRAKSNKNPEIRTAALILAGNTPLMSWSPLCACLLAGYSIFVKMSREETLWPRLFVEALAEVAPEMAARVFLDVWPGEDERTGQLVQGADAVIAFGSDATIQILRDATPENIPFFGFGHGVSIGICTAGGRKVAGDFATDILLYDQGGCLSPQAILVSDHLSGNAVNEAADALRHGLDNTVETLGIPPVTDPATAQVVRSARDMALFTPGVHLVSDPGMRWTIIVHSHRARIDFPTGYGVVQMMPFSFDAGTFIAQLGAVRGVVSSVGVAGELTRAMEEVIRGEGVSRICRAGEMQAPPLDWPNGNVDLLAELLEVG